MGEETLNLMVLKTQPERLATIRRMAALPGSGVAARRDAAWPSPARAQASHPCLVSLHEKQAAHSESLHDLVCGEMRILEVLEARMMTSKRSTPTTSDSR